jgi:uncharacterized membrane protein
VPTAPLFLLGALALLVALSEWLVRRTPLRHLGSALLVIVLASIATNLGLLPSYAEETRVYSAVFGQVAPLGIFGLLLLVDLAALRRAGAPMLVLFLLGSAGTVLGVLAGTALVGGEASFGPLHHALAGMFVGTYTGGSINFNAVALAYDVQREPALYAGATAVDSAMTTVWMVLTVAIPRLLAPFWPAPRRAGARASVGAVDLGIERDTEALHPLDLALLFGLGALVVWSSERAAGFVGERFGAQGTAILFVTSSALLLAQVPAVKRLRGTRVLGMTAVMLFLAVIGTLCDLSALRQLGALGFDLSLFVTILVAVHGLVVFGAAALLRFDLSMAAVASQANIGGGTSALALARSLGRPDLVLPAILVGSLGTALGTYLGFAMAAALG